MNMNSKLVKKSIQFLVMFMSRLAAIRRSNEKKRERAKTINDFESYLYYAQQRITEEDYIAHSEEGEIEVCLVLIYNLNIEN